MPSEVLFIFVMSIILLAIKPGPGQALRITIALRDGFLPAAFLTLGVVIVCNLYLALAGFGSTVINNFFNESGFFFRIIGGIYLIYMGCKGLQYKKATTSRPIPEKPDNYLKYFIMGIILSLSNPVDIFFFVGILPGLIDVSALNLQNISIFMMIMTSILLFVHTIILVVVIQFKNLIIKKEKYKKTLLIVANGGLIMIGLILLYTAFFTSHFSYEIL